MSAVDEVVVAIMVVVEIDPFAVVADDAEVACDEVGVVVGWGSVVGLEEAYLV